MIKWWSQRLADSSSISWYWCEAKMKGGCMPLYSHDLPIGGTAEMGDLITPCPPAKEGEDGEDSSLDVPEKCAGIEERGGDEQLVVQ